MVWQESGALPAANAVHMEEILRGKRAAHTNGQSHAWKLGRGNTPVGVLEACPKGKLSTQTGEWLGLFRQYAEVALESSERRHAGTI